MIILPKLISSHIDKKEDVKNVMFYVLIGLVVVFAQTLLNYFGVFSSAAETSFGFLNNVSFSFFGSRSNQLVMLILGAFLSSHFILRYKDDLSKLVVSSISLLLILVVSVLYYTGFSLLLVFAASLGSLYFYKSLFHKKAIYSLFGAFVISIAFFAVKMSPSLSDKLMLSKTVNPDVKSINFSTSWTVTNSVIGSRLPFGSGVGTFNSDYSAFKPRSVNNTDNWDSSYTKPSSFYLLTLAEMGLVGFLSLLYFVFKYITHGLGRGSELSLKLTKDGVEEFQADLSVAKIFVLGLIISFIFIPSNALVLGLFFGVLGLVLALEKINNTGKVKHRKIGFAIASDVKDREVSSLVISGYSVVQLHVLVVALAIVSLVGASIFTYTVFASDLAYRSYFNTPTNLITLRDAYRKAANLNRNNDFYQRSVIDINSQIARYLAQQNNENTELTEEQKQNNITDIQTLLSEATSRSDYITNGTDLGINPINWEVRGQLHQSLIGLNEQSRVTALQSYNVASSLDPLNPRLVATIGTVYYAAEDYDQARQLFERAVILKPDYAAARFNLANSLEKLGKEKEAYDVAKTIPALLDVDSDDYKNVNTYITSLDKKIKDKAEQVNSEGTVPSDLGLGKDQELTKQPALTNPNQPLESVSETTLPSDPQPSKGSELPNQNPNTDPGAGFIEGQ